MNLLRLTTLLLLILPGRAAAEEIPPLFWDFFDKHCAECHDPAVAEGDFHDEFLRISQSPEDAEYWQLVLDNLHLGDMPPPEEPQPSIEELEPVIAWIEGELQRARRAMRGHTGEVVLRRLNETEYRHTIQDLFDIRGDFTAAFPDDTEEEGFDNIGAALMLSAAQIDAYLGAADRILARAIEDGPQPKSRSTRFTLHDINQRIWESERRGLERRLAGFDNLTAQEQQRTRDLQRKFEANPYSEFGYPAWVDGKPVAPTPEMGPEIDALMGTRSTASAGPSDTGRFFQVRDPGWYDFRITAYAVMNNGQPVRLRLYHGSGSASDVPRSDETIYFSDDTPRTIERRLYMLPGDRVSFDMMDGPNWGRGSSLLKLGPYLAVRSVEMEGPIHESWPPKGHRVIFGDRDLANLDADAVRGIIEHFGPRLFRRPVPSGTVQEFVDLYETFTVDMAPKDALRATLKAMMVSPHFLYHLEPPSQIDAYALANRLSYFLWRSMPDDELFTLAFSGKLDQPATLRAQVERMLADPKSERFLTDFTNQWLWIDQLGEMQPDSQLYPEYDEELERAMGQETHRFIAELLREDLSLVNLLDSDWAILNERLARHYGIPGVTGPEFRRVSLNKSQTVRGGLLTHASILNLTSNGTTTSPVVRGVFLLDHILGTPAPPPPPDVPPIEPDIRGASTIKQQLAKHREIPQCSSCHQKIDPFGVALENFDVIGGWREKYRALENTGGRQPKLIDGKTVESDDTIPKMGAYQDFEEFRSLLLEHEELVFHNMAHKLATFALGRTMDFADREDLEHIVAHTRANGGGMKTMLHALVQSPIFQRP